MVAGLGLSLGVSAFLAFVGAFGSAAAPFWPRMISFLVFGLGTSVLVTPVVWLSERIAWLAARPMIRRLVIALVLTPLIGGWLWAAVCLAFLHGLKPALLPSFLGYSLIMSFAMTALSWAVFRRRAPTAPAGAAPSALKFMARLPFRLREAALYAVEAEDHYLRVRTSLGSELILMRLSDAVEELEGLDGAQTHRSWWVAKAAIADVKRADGRAVLTLKDGAEAPVSRTQARALRQAGWF
ncbi:MAG TPA: LytTR family DNA-binding domain-containing protein [Caulobacteraceae bacterium]